MDDEKMSPAVRRAMDRIRAAIEERKAAEACFTERCSQDVAHKIRQEQGWKYTPDQVAEIRDRALAKIRAELTAKGYTLPETDVGLMILLRRLAR